jgi:RNA recognition motif-containing protein
MMKTLFFCSNFTFFVCSEQVEMITNYSSLTNEAKEEIDSRSVFVGNVDFSATAEELQQHFQAAGTINRITILCDKFTGHPKGYTSFRFSFITFSQLPNSE